MNFEFASAGRVVFGWGRIAELPDLARPFGKRALLVTGGDATRASPAREALQKSGVEVKVRSASGEPTVDLIRSGAQAARSVDFVVGFGGGAAIDAAKAIAAVTPNSGEPLDYLEVIGAGRALTEKPLPWIAIPTTAGTGAEVTRNAVLGSPQHGVKASLRSPEMLAAVALVDPQLTTSSPPRVTADSGVDTLTQLIEPYVSVRSNPLTDSFCKQGLSRLPAALETAFADGRNRPARESMAFCSLLSGLALSNAGLGAVHGIAGPLGGAVNAPHGALCAALLPFVIQTNIAALRRREPHHPALHRYAEIAAILTGNARAEPEDAAIWVFALRRTLAVRPLQAFGLQREQIGTVVENAARASSMRANPIPLGGEEIADILLRALGES